MAYAVYRGQRFNVVSEDARFVTLEGFGYKKRVQKEEVIFEEKPEDQLLTQVDEPVELLAKEEEKPLPSEISDKDLITPPEVSAAPEVAPVYEESFDFDMGDIKDEIQKLSVAGVELETLMSLKGLKLIAMVAPNLINFMKTTQSNQDADHKAESDQIAKFISDVYGISHSEALNGLKKMEDALSGELKEDLAKHLVSTGPESYSTPAPEVENKQQPDLKKVGLNLAVDTTPGRREENEKRRKAFVGTMKSKLQEMLAKLEEMEAEDVEEVKIEENETVAPTNVNGPGTTSDSAVPFAGRVGIGLNKREREDEKLKNVK